MVVATVLVLVALFFLGGEVSLSARTPLPRSAEVLVAKAQDHLERLGFRVERLNNAYAFDLYEEYIQQIHERDSSAGRWNRLAWSRPTAIDFWYRQGPEPLVASNLKGRVTWEDPPPMRPGMVQLRLDPEGRLRELLSVSPKVNQPIAGPTPSHADARPAFPWEKLFQAAALDIKKFRPVEPQRVPLTFADRRAAWEGRYPENPEVEIRVEAASLDGRPTAFRIIENAFPEASVTDYDPMRSTGVVLETVFRLVLLLAALAMSWHALRTGRGDRQGALRVGIAVFVLMFSVTVLTGNHAADLRLEGRLLLRGMAQGLLMGVQFMLFYFALEPHVRRIWPETLSSWTRLLKGRFRDPLIGMNVLVGQLGGAIVAVLVYLVFFSQRWTGLTSCPPCVDPLVADRLPQALMGTRFHLGSFLESWVLATGFGMFFLLGLVLFRLLLRNRILAIVLYGALQTAIWSLMAPHSIYGMFFFAGVAAVSLFMTVQVGLLSMIVGVAVYILLLWFPLTLNMADWKSGATLFVLAMMAVLTVFGASNILRQRT